MQSLAFVWQAGTIPAARRSFPVIQGGVRTELPRLPLRQLILIRTGDEVARQALLDTWLPVVEREADRYGRAGGNRDELAAEGALALWEAVLQYDPQHHRTAPEMYVHNHIHRRVRRQYRTGMGFGGLKLVPVEALTREATEEEAYGAAEQHHDLENALAELKPAEREHLEQYLQLALAGMGPDEAARALSQRSGDSFAAIKKRLERVRRKVKNRLIAVPCDRQMEH